MDEHAFCRTGQKHSLGARFAALAAFAFLAVGALACAGPAHAAGDAHITGRVTDESGASLQSIYVVAYTRRWWGWGWSGSANSTGSGGYDVAGLNAGTYRVGFHDWASWTGGYATEYYDDKPDIESADDVTVAAGDIRSGIDARLAPGSHITGVVRDGSGRPLSRISASALARRSWGWEWIAVAETTASGGYDMGADRPSLGAGTYRVEFSDWLRRYATEYYDDKPDLDSADDVTVAAGATRSGIDARLARYGRVVGRVTDELSVPLQNIQVVAYARNPWGWDRWDASARTDASGTYVIGGLNAGTYRIGFHDSGRRGQPYPAYLTEYYDDKLDLESADDVAVTLDATRSGIDARLAKYGIVSGVIENEEHVALGGVQVAGYRYSRGTWQWARSAATTDSGGYVLGGLFPGTFRIGFFDPSLTHAPEYYDDARSLWTARDVAMAPNTERAGVNAHLARGSHIVGTVTSEATGGPIPGIKVLAIDPATVSGYDGIRVAAASPALVSGYASRSGPGRGIAPAVTDESGAYDIPGLAPGRYLVCFFGTEDYLGECYRDAPDVGSATDVTVATGANTLGVDAQLASAAHIAGTVVDQDNDLPIGRIRVNAFEFVDGVSGYGFAAMTDDSGKYSVGGLKASTYLIRFSDPSHRYHPEYFEDAIHVSEATTVSIGGGATRGGLDAGLGPLGRISGTVRGPDGSPAWPTWVTAYRLTASRWGSWWDWAGYCRTDSSGAYDIGRLTAGSYRIGFRRSGSVSEYYDDAPDLARATDVTLAPGLIRTSIDATLAAVAPDPTGRVSGRVCDEVSGAAISGAQVRAYKLVSGCWVSSSSVVAGASGEYEFARLGVGTYRFGFSASGRSDEYYDDAPSLAVATNVEVSAEASMTGIDAHLDPGVARGHITGTVMDESGSARLAGISVLALGQRQGGWIWAGSASTDASGTYDIGGLSPGAYKLRFEDESDWAYASEYYDDKPDLESATEIILGSDAGRAGIDVRLARAAHIKGTVTSSEGGGTLEGVCVEAYQSRSGAWVRVAHSDSNPRGAYALAGLRAGAYRIGFLGSPYYRGEYYDNAATVDLAGDVAVSSGQTRGGIDAALDRRAGAGRLGGMVRGDDTGGPVDGVSVSILEKWGLDRSGKRPNWREVAWARTGASGGYQVGGLAAGDYKVRFTDPLRRYLGEYHEDTGTVEGGSDVGVSTHTVARVDASLARAARIRGVVRRAGASGRPPILGIEVAARAHSAPESGYWFRAFTDEAGRYDLRGLSTDTYYTLRFSDPNAVYATEYYDDAATTDTARRLSVTNGETYAGTDADLAVRGRIAGRVTRRSDGSPIRGIAVAVFDFANPYSGYQFRAATDGTGGYGLDGIDTGSYRVRFVDWDAGYVGQYWNDQTREASATDVLVGPGASVGSVDARLVDSGHIRGRVTAADTNGALGGLYLWLFQQGGGSGSSGGRAGRSLASGVSGAGSWVWVRTTKTDASGNYDFGGLDTGIYRVLAKGNSSYGHGCYGGSRSLENAWDVSVSAGAVTAGVDLRLPPLGDITPPGPVASFRADPGDGRVALTWTNPADSDYSLTRILRSETGAAGSPTPTAGQVVVYEGTLTLKTDDSLTNGKTYHYTAFARDVAGNWSTPATANATPLAPPPPPPPPDITPPGPVASFRADPGDGRVALTWTNPADSDYSLTRILRSETGVAGSPTPTAGQVVVYEGTLTLKTDDSLTNGKTYHYTAFARDVAGNWSTPATSNATPRAVIGKAKLSRPVVRPTRPSRRRAFTVSGTVTKHLGRTAVRVYFYRKVRGKWRYYKYSTVKTASGSSAYRSRYRGLPYAGKWYVKAWHRCGDHLPTWSAPRYFSVR